MNLKNFNFKTLIPIRFCDMDAFGHVNNALYLTYFEIARSSYWKEVVRWDWSKLSVVIGKAEVNYLVPLKYGDVLYAYVRTSRTGKSSFDLEYVLAVAKKDSEEIVATGKTVCIAYDHSIGKSVPIPDYQLAKMKDFEMLVT
ncbi:acyl-CoA thioesterase [Pedobacter sp. HMF7647]|uniref:Acyl-CoA thioesterase n=1 Tax=Hufsiella arboris TaxID=2695275 RepID=A0A7K1Y7C6_9SPHI|nr:thioesterase family protein [Hufsiella arboris]MXV50474.1 acyl-CoA thioesterase [Hufsiella arboris]